MTQAMLSELEFTVQQGDLLTISIRGGGAETIKCAELTATASTVLLMGQERDEIIATDSQASICMIATYMGSPQPLQRCKHNVKLEGIVTRFLARARKGIVEPRCDDKYKAKIQLHISLLQI